MISIAFALALAASPAPATAPAAGACTLLNLGACADAGALVRDPAFQAALRQFVGRRVTGYLSSGGFAYNETMTVLGGPADPVRRLRSLYVFTACADASCDQQGAVVLQPDGELAAVAIVHDDCGELRRAGDCLSREVLSILRGPDDDFSVVDNLSDWARKGIAARPLTPGTPIRNLDRVEAIALSDSPASALASARPRPAPPITLPRNPEPAPAPAPPPPAIAAIRPLLAPPAAPPIARIEPPPVQLPAAPARPPAPALAAAPPAPAAPAKPESSRAEAAAPSEPGVTPVEAVEAVAPPRVPRIFTPMKVYLTLVRDYPQVVIVPPPPPPPPPPKPPRTGWQWHSTPYDCRRPKTGHLAIAGLGLDPLAATCTRWNDQKPK